MAILLRGACASPPPVCCRLLFLGRAVVPPQNSPRCAEYACASDQGPHAWAGRGTHSNQSTYT